MLLFYVWCGNTKDAGAEGLLCRFQGCLIAEQQLGRKRIVYCTEQGSGSGY